MVIAFYVQYVQYYDPSLTQISHHNVFNQTQISCEYLAGVWRQPAGCPDGNQRLFWTEKKTKTAVLLCVEVTVIGNCVFMCITVLCIQWPFV